MAGFRIAVELECCGGEEVELEVQGEPGELYSVWLGEHDIIKDLTDKDFQKVHERFAYKYRDWEDDLKLYGG